MAKAERGAVRYESPYGPGWIIHKDDEISEIQLPGASPLAPESPVPPDALAALAVELTAYFAGGPWVEHPEFADKAAATPFTKAVYEVVAAIPAGAVRTYGDVAGQLNRPGAARAVGRAMATNPFPIVIPCHRVVGSNGSLTGFAGGVEMKAEMLRMEGALL